MIVPSSVDTLVSLIMFVKSFSLDTGEIIYISRCHNKKYIHTVYIYICIYKVKLLDISVTDDKYADY